MDRLPSKLPNTASRLIAMAVSLVGEEDKVMKHMQCSRDAFVQYCEGRKVPTRSELDRLITLVVREQGSSIARSRALLAARRRKTGAT